MKDCNLQSPRPQIYRSHFSHCTTCDNPELLDQGQLREWIDINSKNVQQQINGECNENLREPGIGELQQAPPAITTATVDTISNPNPTKNGIGMNG